MPAVPRVSLKQVNHYLWRRQRLDLKESLSPNQLADDLVGLYGSAPTCYLSILARSPDFQFQQLDDALYQARSLARLRAMRYTVFLSTRKMFPVFYQATRKVGDGDFRNLVRKSGIPEKEFAQVSKQIMKVLTGKSMGIAEIKNHLPKLSETAKRGLGFVVPLMSAQGLLVRAGVCGGWKSNLFVYARLVDWLSGVELDSISPHEARLMLGRAYFRAYGPATAEDFGWWIGLNKSDWTQAMQTLKNKLTTIEIKGLESDYLLFPEDVADLEKAPDLKTESVNLLPVWDNYMMAYKNRLRYVAEDKLLYVYDRGGNSTSLILVRGQVAGLWDFEETKHQLRLKVSFFSDPPASTLRELSAAAKRLSAALEKNEVKLKLCDLPKPLATAGLNVFRTPLKDAIVRREIGL